MPFLLSQWCLWARVNKAVKLGYPTYSFFARDTLEERPMPVISEETALAIDYLVAMLIKYDSLMGNVLVAYYMTENYTKAGKQHQISRAKAKELVAAGNAWLDAKIDDSDD